LGLAGLFAAYFGLRQWLRVKRIERLATKDYSYTESGAATDGGGT